MVYGIRTLHWQRMGREVGALFRARGSGPRVGTPSAGRVATTQQTFHLNQPIPCHCYNSIQYTKYRTGLVFQSLMQLARKYGLLLVCPSSSRCIKVLCNEYVPAVWVRKYSLTHHVAPCRGRCPEQRSLRAALCVSAQWKVLSCVLHQSATHKTQT